MAGLAWEEAAMFESVMTGGPHMGTALYVRSLNSM